MSSRAASFSLALYDWRQHVVASLLFARGDSM